ncbi:MAG: pstA2 [Acidimicrobiaceae bacterium]|nr:pstA2 [Acidimicrobiaceae bacterium]
MAGATASLAGATASLAGSARRGPPAISWRRRIVDNAWWGLCWVGLLAVVGVVVWILAGVASRAFSDWKWSVLWTQSTGTGGGLANTIAGTFVILVGVAILAGAVGIGAGVYLAETARPGPVTTFLRSASEVLSGVPSIVFGYVGYITLVIGLHWGYSLLAALIVLSLLVVPYVAKATELSLGQVPLAYREGGEALGMTKTYRLRRVVMPSAIPGIATGLIVALAISVGETAPLIYTASFTNAYPSIHLLHQPVSYLTYAAYTFFDEPSRAAQQLSADAALLLVALVLILIVLARVIVRLTQKYSPERGAGSGSFSERRAARRAQAGAD